jgi:hypothetical protein
MIHPRFIRCPYHVAVENASGEGARNDEQEEEMPDLEQSISNTQDVAVLPEAQLKAVAEAAMKNLGSDAQADVMQQARVQLPTPGLEASEKLWRIIVTSFSIVLVGAFLALALIGTGTVGYLYNSEPAGDVMLTVFTTAAGFLAGLLSPSPVTTSPGGGGG